MNAALSDSIATLTRTLTVTGHKHGSEVEAVVTSNRGGLGPVTHSFPPSHQGGRGTTIERQPLPSQQPTKEVYLTPPLHEQQWNETQFELSESTLRGSPNLPDHPKENPHGRVGSTSESPRSGWRCGRPRSTG